MMEGKRGLGRWLMYGLDYELDYGVWYISF